MIRPIVVMACALLLTLGSRDAPAEDKETPAAALARAKERAATNDVLGALDAVADAVAAAHRSDDLVAEGEAAAILDGLVPRIPAMVITGGAGGRAPSHVGRIDILVRFMDRLSASRPGALVAAHSLARNIGLRAAEEYTETGREAAADVLRAWEVDGAASGIGDIHREWTSTMSALRFLGKIGSGKTDGFTRLRNRIAKAVDEEWAIDAILASTEMAAFKAVGKDNKEALEAMRMAGRACREAADPRLVARWERAVARQMPRAPETVTEPLRTLRGKFPALAGGAGGTPPGAETGLGRFLPTAAPDAVVAKVRRTPKGFTVYPGWDARASWTVDVGPGVRYLYADGLVLAFDGRAVGVHALDLKGTLGKPGDGDVDLEFRALVPLGKTDTWILRKNGRAEVSR
jgi:hypothetical protein